MNNSTLRPGDWVVVARRSYGQYVSHEYGQLDSVKTKVAFVKTGPGSSATSRVGLEDIIPVADKEAARALISRLDSAEAECIRRCRAATDAYKSTIGKIYARALEAAKEPQL